MNAKAFIAFLVIYNTTYTYGKLFFVAISTSPNEPLQQNRNNAYANDYLHWGKRFCIDAPGIFLKK